MYRRDIPFNPVESYLWWNESTLPKDAEFNPRWNYNVSRCCSSIYITGGTLESIFSQILFEHFIGVLIKIFRFDHFITKYGNCL